MPSASARTRACLIVGVGLFDMGRDGPAERSRPKSHNARASLPCALWGPGERQRPLRQGTGLFQMASEEVALAYLQWRVPLGAGSCFLLPSARTGQWPRPPARPTRTLDLSVQRSLAKRGVGAHKGT